ncbi:MAG: hypothetical protein QOG51_2068 [Verrucomicrobiota bacterium]|jgi:hypothetical protein
MRIHSNHRIGRVLAAIFFASFVTASSWGAVVWDLNPNHQNAPVGSSSHTYTSSGFSITAYGFDNHSGIGTAHDLYYKNVSEIGGAVEFGLGLVNTPNNEIQTGLHFIQFDFTSMLAAGMLHGQISVGSVQANEAFAIYGSNSLGTLGTQVGGTYGSSFDNQFVSISNFGQFHYYSVVATADDVLPIAIRADLPPVPEMNAIVPIAALLLLVMGTTLWRKRVA